MNESLKVVRLDQKVVELLPSISRAHIGKLIEGGKVTVNGKVVLKNGYRLKLEDKVAIDYDVNHKPKLPDLKLKVIYEDQDCTVIYKPVGILAHSKGNFNPEATIASWLTQYVTDMSGNRAGIVHRLDRATSGVMICAKTPQAMQWLQKQFSSRKVKKTYLAVIVGELQPNEAIIDMPIERNPKQPSMFRVGPNGKSAITKYKVLKTNSQYSLVELQPETGRTHQLRVHLKAVNHPILGDDFYGGEPADRLFLHAYKLEITLPNKQRQIFTAKVPKEFNDIVA